MVLPTPEGWNASACLGTGGWTRTSTWFRLPRADRRRLQRQPCRTGPEPGWFSLHRKAGMLQRVWEQAAGRELQPGSVYREQIAVDFNGNPVAPARNPDGSPYTGRLECFSVFGNRRLDENFNLVPFTASRSP